MPTRTIRHGETVEVPAADAARLRELRSQLLGAGGRGGRLKQDDPTRAYGQELDRLCAELAARGYSLGQIGQALGGVGPDGVDRRPVSREGVRQRVARVPAAEVAGVEPEIVRESAAAPAPRPAPPAIPEDKLKVLTALYPTSQQRRRDLPEDHPAMVAGRKVDGLLAEMYLEDGISMGRLADALGVTRRAVRLRIERQKAPAAS